MKHSYRKLKKTRSAQLIFAALSLFLLVPAGLLSGQETVPASGINITTWYLPIRTENRQSLHDVKLTPIGTFGTERRARPGIPAHLHTGIDLKRPNANYIDEPVFPAARGKVISLRNDGPFAQIIIRHSSENSMPVWTVYEHIAGIKVRHNDEVDPSLPIARFMTRAELNQYGWQFDHLHFEVMKAEPVRRQPERGKPFFYYGTYCLECHTLKDLDDKYHHPLDYLKYNWHQTH